MGTREAAETAATDATWPVLSPIATGARGRCPRCGRGRLFSGYLTLAERCTVCGLDYGFADPADGPAVFVQLFACVPGAVFLVLLEVIAEPPLWVHLVTSLPILIVTTLVPLRPIKGWLVASQYRFRAQEGRVRDDAGTH